VAVAGGLTFAWLSAGASYTCAVTTGGAAYCWGYNGTGQLGDGTTTLRRTPVAVKGGPTFAMVLYPERHCLLQHTAPASQGGVTDRKHSTFTATSPSFLRSRAM
jgi:alpha-tubulin suppressor-like RCC1 family protein